MTKRKYKECCYVAVVTHDHIIAEICDEAYSLTGIMTQEHTLQESL